ncbi:MAG: succinate dehydrogenase/fumarate reductase iron-sulfur subunit [Methanomicrobiales archaeon]|nr:succinate dehydrogenase/fumarate reductase iron-sulfur subunit [Methanomicrobiales archaeon]
MKTIIAKVSRFDPGRDEAPHLHDYTVEVYEGARVLHVLHAIHDTIDPSISYRYCCGSGQCGSCAVRVDGEPVLACMEEARDGMTVQPLDLPVVRDLTTDLAPTLRSVPFLAPRGDAIVLPCEVVEEIKPLRSCIECLACVSVCPAMKVTSFTGPTAMRQEMRLTLDPRDTRDRIEEAVAAGLFTCTSCQACWKACPKEIAIPGKAIERLRAYASTRGFTLPRHREVAALIRETGRSVTRTAPGFLEEVPIDNPPKIRERGVVGFFVGCMYNLRLPAAARDAMEVLSRNGIRVVIPPTQVCCGSPLIRTGQTEFLATLKERNIDAFVTRGISRVMTMCAGCGTTLKNDYSTPFEVLDINEVLTEHDIEPPAHLFLRVTYHDPCHLLRGQGIRNQPRALITQVADLVEIPAICCGSGGGVKSGNPDEAAALGSRRGEAIAASGAEAVISSCPFCEFHISGHTDRPVENIASLLLKGYRTADERKGGR